jgi:hypothetical protein
LASTVSPEMIFAIVSTPSSPMPAVSCETVPARVPALIAATPSSVASTPKTWICPVLPAFSIACTAPTAMPSFWATIALSSVPVESQFSTRLRASAVTQLPDLSKATFTPGFSLRTLS